MFCCAEKQVEILYTALFVLFLAHPDSAEAAARDGGRAGGVPIGSAAVRRLCQRPDRQPPVSTHLHLRPVTCLKA